MNTNPIKLDEFDPSNSTTYGIPAKYSKTMIYLTLKVKLLDEGWLFASAHSVFLELNNLYPGKTPEPVDLKLNYAVDLDGLRLGVISHVSRFRNGSENANPSRVEYRLILEAGDELLDEFVLVSGQSNPSSFNSFIQFKLI
jgi:hypothetical protein